jgi:hypothetical protein
VNDSETPTTIFGGEQHIVAILAPSHGSHRQAVKRMLSGKLSP